MVVRVPLNLPNQLTLLRILLCGAFLAVLSVSWPFAWTSALVIFVAASLTDWLDGEIARRWNLITNLGKLLDPLADKILVTAALVSLVERQLVPMWMVVVIIAREFLITGLRTMAALHHRVLAAERVGKHKTISQIVAVLDSLAWLSLCEWGWQQSFLARAMHTAQAPLYWIALLITIWSGAVYFIKNRQVLDAALPDRSTQPPSVPAFKEWAGIVEALGRGRQTIILRKGGIAEGRKGFQPSHPKFWLFPTGFHQQWEKTRPELREFLGESEAPGPITLRYVAEVTDAVYLDRWEQIERLHPFHFWSENQVRERFEYKDRPGMEVGLHLLVVRIFRVTEPQALVAASAYDGCKSWISVPVAWPTLSPVLSDLKFSEQRQVLLHLIGSVSA